MHILMLTSNLPEKGTFWRAFHLARILTARGHEVSLFLTARKSRLRGKEYDTEGVHLLETPDWLWSSLRSGWDPWNILFRRLQIRRSSFDLVHAFESRPAVIYPALYAQRRGAKLVLDWCDWFGKGGSVEERPQPILRFLLRPLETYYEEHFRRYPQGTTVINRFLRQKALSMGVAEENILLLPNGCDTRIPTMDKEAARVKLGLALDRRYIGMIGNLYSRDARLMLQAFRRVSAENPNCSLLLIGNFHRPLDRCLIDPIAHSVKFSGIIPSEELSAWSAACDLFWCPLIDSGANHGRFPLKLNDYLLSARPIVATDVGEIGSWIQEHDVGVLAGDNPEDFAGKTLELLNDEEKRLHMGMSARRVADTCLDWTSIGRQLETFYLRILAPDRMRPSEDAVGR